jgi:hypothetical protein
LNDKCLKNGTSSPILAQAFLSRAEWPDEFMKKITQNVAQPFFCPKFMRDRKK